MKQEIDKLEVITSKADLWDNPDKARVSLQKKELLQKKYSRFLESENNFNDEVELLELALKEEDSDTVKDSEKNLAKLLRKLNVFKIEALFAGDADSNNCFLEIHPGAGGTESHDWAEMMLRMYLRWAEKKEFQCEILDEQKGDEAGIKSVTIRIIGENAYGWLKNESGVHRLVRISPFNSGGKRMTSFASAWIYPEIDENINIEIEEKDLRVDTYRASGAGGQHVNKTDSAIRITHIPTNIAVQCQNSRSQHRNRDEAMKMLKSRLYELELRKKQEETDSMNAAKTEIGWGNQIRSYVLQPYQMVKDLRTNFEVGNVNSVLDGDLDDLMTSLLTHNRN